MAKKCTKNCVRLQLRNDIFVMRLSTKVAAIGQNYESNANNKANILVMEMKDIKRFLLDIF